jgi:hypothetical protein
MRRKFFLVLVVGLVLGFLSNQPLCAQSWSNGYAFRAALTIDHTKVPNTDQSNFPVLISGVYPLLATVANGGGVVNANGYDIIFTSDAAGTAPLPFERESYSPLTGAVNYWVQIPTLSHTIDTVIYLFYGNGSITSSQANPAGVWDSNYKGVWHLSQNPTGPVIPSGWRHDSRDIDWGFHVCFYGLCQSERRRVFRVSSHHRRKHFERILVDPSSSVLGEAGSGWQYF